MPSFQLIVPLNSISYLAAFCKRRKTLRVKKYTVHCSHWKGKPLGMTREFLDFRAREFALKTKKERELR